MQKEVIQESMNYFPCFGIAFIGVIGWHCPIHYIFILFKLHSAAMKTEQGKLVLVRERGQISRNTTSHNS